MSGLSQFEYILKLKDSFHLEGNAIHSEVPAGSTLVIGRSKSTGKVAWIEIVEPEPTHKWSWDTGEPRE